MNKNRFNRRQFISSMAMGSLGLMLLNPVLSFGNAIEKLSGLKNCIDFKLGYSPERINPGDKKHTLRSVVKVVSGCDEESLDVIAKQACLSTKQFYRRFTERIGISPKFFSRLARFNHAYQYKIAHPNVYWSSIAQQFDYTDYHHVEKEFKEFTALTPQQWIAEDQAAPERILHLR